MGMNVGKGSSNLTSDINVTPFCDVCLVLLIIFMVVTPLLQKGVPVQLPTVRNPEIQDEKESNIYITVQLNPLRNGKPFGAVPNGTPLINCGKSMPTGGCNADTGTVYLSANN